MEKRKLIVILSHEIVIDFANFLTIFNFALTDYWHDRRAYVNGSFRSGSFLTWSFRPSVLSIRFGGSFPPIISSHELSCSQGELIVTLAPASVRPPFSNIFSQPIGQSKINFMWKPPSEDGTKLYINYLEAATPIYDNQRTNGPVNAHLISWPSKAQNKQNLENIW